MLSENEVNKIVKAERDHMTNYDKKRDKGLKVPKEIKCFYDIPYSKDAEECKLDVYKPRRSSKKALPVIVSIHGGAWIYGDKELYSFYCMELARRGFAVINFTYRLAPEYKFPSAIQDTNNVFKWLIKNAAEYNFDTENIFATGDSAGANYLAIYANILTNKDYALNFSLKVPARLKLKGVYLNCGVYDCENFTNDKNHLALMQALMPKGGTKKEAQIASPHLYVTENFPKAFIITAQYDFLRPMASIMAQSLCKAGTDFRFKCYSNKKEKLYHVFMLNLRSKDGTKCIDEQCEWFKSLLQQK